MSTDFRDRRNLWEMNFFFSPPSSRKGKQLNELPVESDVSTDYNNQANVSWSISNANFLTMTNAYSFEGLLVFGLLVICTCAYMRRVPRLRQWFLSEKKGFLGVFYKASVIGTRLHIPVALSCILMGLYILLLK